MSTVAIGLVGVVAAAAAAVVGGAMWSGQVAQQRLQADMAVWLEKLPVKVIQSTYEKTLFSATQTVVLMPGCDEGDADETQAKSITLRQHVQHGPLPGFTRIGWTVVDTDVLMPGQLRDQLQNVPESQALVSAHTVIGLFGGFTSHVSTPKLEFKEDPAAPGKVVVQGAELNLRGSSLSSGSLSYDMVWPGLAGEVSTEASDSRFKVGRMTWQGDGQFDAKDPMRMMIGKARFELDQMELQSTPKGAGKPTTLTLREMKGQSDATLENQELLNRTSTLTAQGQFNDLKVTKLDMQASMKRMHLPTYAQLLQQAWSPATLCEASEHPEEMVQQAQALMNAMLSHNPEISLDKLEIEMDGQTGSLSYQVGTQGITAEEAASAELIGVLMTKAYANGQAKVPMAWIEKAMIDKLPQREVPDKAVLDAMIGEWVDKGVVVRQDNFLVSQFKLDKGQLLLNGKPLH